MTVEVVADFETTTDPDDCRVWGWGVANVSHDPKFLYGTTIDEFMREFLDKSWTIYFHNLGFDGSFILNWLLRNGYKWTLEKRRLKVKEFTTLISDMGKYYSITVKPNHHSRVEFRDSLKVIPMSVKMIPKAFNLEDDAKGEIDYDKSRPPGYEPTDEEWDYIREDVTIVAKALAQQRDQGMKKLTIGADALADYKNTHTKQWWDTTFPVLPLDIDTDIRNAYRGGFTYVSPQYQKRIVGPIKVFDVNSLYPSVMYQETMPCGVPEWVEGRPEVTDDYPLFVAKILFTAKVKPNHIPCIQVKGSAFFMGTEYQTEVTEPLEMWVSSVDLELWQEQYDLDILAWVCAYRFKGIRGAFNTYIEKWSKVKAESTGGKRTISKLFLNSLYGKYATNPNVTGKYPVLENDRLKLKLGAEEMRDPVYTAVGVFITAYARARTVRAAQAHYSIFAYADTDSLHLVTDEMPTDLDIHPTRLGAWKHEDDFDRGYFGRAKCYTEMRVNGDGEEYWSTHIAGMPTAVAESVRFHHYDQETHFPGKLVPRQVPGGIVLEDVGFTLKV